MGVEQKNTTEAAHQKERKQHAHRIGHKGVTGLEQTAYKPSEKGSQAQTHVHTRTDTGAHRPATRAYGNNQQTREHSPGNKHIHAQT